MKKFTVILCALMLLSGKAFCQEEISAEKFEELRIFKNGLSGPYENGEFFGFRGHGIAFIQPVFEKILLYKSDSILVLKGYVIDAFRQNKPNRFESQILVGEMFYNYHKPDDTTGYVYDSFATHENFSTDSLAEFELKIKLKGNELICFTMAKEKQLAKDLTGTQTGHCAMYEVFKLLEE